ncbi:MAG: hypothetical protein ACPG8W_22025 [Candidatus Promineifilaceae bacterium]
MTQVHISNGRNINIGGLELGAVTAGFTPMRRTDENGTTQYWVINGSDRNRQPIRRPAFNAFDRHRLQIHSNLSTECDHH